MRKIIILFSTLIFVSCQNANTITSKTPNPTITSSPISASKYTREDYIRIFTCTLDIKDKSLSPSNRGKIAAHLSLIKNDTVWPNIKNNFNEYDLEVETISKPLNCN
jgi:hypothetical protein